VPDDASIQPISTLSPWTAQPQVPMQDLVETALPWVEEHMRSAAAGTRLERIGLIVQEHLDTGGKRLRARLALAAGASLGADVRAIVPWASSVELLHNASLVHDDLQDGDTVRRGEPTTWVRHGAAQAINAGDLMLMLPFTVTQAVPVGDDVRWRLAHALASSAVETVRGQAAEMDLLPLRRLGVADYLRVVEGKTASLLAVPVEGAALIAGHSVTAARDLARPFRQLGTLFQLQDDVLDLYGDKGRREVGADLREGKVSALVVEHLALHPADEGALVDLLDTPRECTADEDVDAWISRFASSGALRMTLERIVTIRDVLEADLAALGQPGLRIVGQTLCALALAPIAHVLASHGHLQR
jgi:geranylgeranyl diphosphate synthase type I